MSPRILRLALSGELSPRIALRDLYDAGKILDWRVQESMLGLDRKMLCKTETANRDRVGKSVVSENGD